MLEFIADHDYHIHSTLSTCCHDQRMTADAILAAVLAEGHKEVCITNHLWDADMPGADEWYAPQDIAHVLSILPLPESDRVKVRLGCETEFCGGTKIGLSPTHYDLFEFIIVPFNHLHNNFSRPRDVVTAAQVAALYVDHFEDLLLQPLPWKRTGIAHLTCPLTFPHDNLHEVFDLLDETRMRRIFDVLAKRGAGIELNGACFRPGWEKHEGSFLRVYRMAKEAGCTFYCGSDAHALQEIPSLKTNIAPVIEKLGLRGVDRFRL